MAQSRAVQAERILQCLGGDSRRKNSKKGHSNMHPINPDDLICLILIVTIGFIILDLIWGKD